MAVPSEGLRWHASCPIHPGHPTELQYPGGMDLAWAVRRQAQATPAWCRGAVAPGGSRPRRRMVDAKLRALRSCLAEIDSSNFS